MQYPLENLAKYSIKLASKSPRRRQLLSMLDIDFTLADILEVEEVIPPNLPPQEVPEYLANLKASAYKESAKPGELFITADTVVILDDRILGKPSDIEDAVKMLSALAGNTHKVVTGVCVFTCDRRESFSVETLVEFAPLSPDEIRYYVERYRPLDKAGAYGIQEWIGAAAIKRIEGSFYNVMGLPLHRLFTCFKGF